MSDPDRRVPRGLGPEHEVQPEPPIIDERSRPAVPDGLSRDAAGRRPDCGEPADCHGRVQGRAPPPLAARSAEPVGKPAVLEPDGASSSSAAEAHDAQRGLGPEHDVPFLDRHAEALFRHYHEPPTLAEHAEMVQSDPLAGVPARGLARIMWAGTRAGFRDAWARLRQHLGR